MPTLRECQGCGVAFSRPPSVKATFCSRACQNANKPRKSLEERFWAMVDVHLDGCWIWTGRPDSTGYGQINSGGREGELLMAHKVSWAIHGRDVPEGLELDHLCHNADLTCAGGATCRHRLCVNPSHLEPVTHQVNSLRGRSVSAQNAQKTHCPQGHPYGPESLPKSDGCKPARVCRTCKRERDAARRRPGEKRHAA